MYIQVVEFINGTFHMIRNITLDMKKSSFEKLIEFLVFEQINQ